MADRAALRERAVAATRQLAKRQLTWLRSFRDVEPAERLPHSFL
jgi:tRNA A37 N6-isopentenylltransferase MiaA